MKIFLDSADISEIEAHIASGFVDGVTTNPSLIAKSGRNILETIAQICEMVDGPVSAEVAATDFETMLKEGKKLAALAPNVTVKVPLTEAGLRTCRELREVGTQVNVTLCFTAGQALLAAKAGATFISPFVGRLDDIGHDGMGLIEEICTIYDQYDMPTEVLVASVRSTQHVVDAAMLGADVVTLPPKILTALYQAPADRQGSGCLHLGLGRYRTVDLVAAILVRRSWCGDGGSTMAGEQWQASNGRSAGYRDAHRRAWLAWLETERRYGANTLAAYAADLDDYLRHAGAEADARQAALSGLACQHDSARSGAQHDRAPGICLARILPLLRAHRQDDGR
jgi:transaldolase